MKAPAPTPPSVAAGGPAAPTAAVASRAARRLQALADPGRAEVWAVVLAAGADGMAAADLSARLGRDLRGLARDLGTLTSAGLVDQGAGRVVGRPDALGAAADELLAAGPVAGLLAERPELARWFRFGRLEGLPLESRSADRAGLATLLVRLLPADRSLTEDEVNAALAQAGDDVALLRRFLVDQGRLSRDAGRDYRVVPG